MADTKGTAGDDILNGTNLADKLDGAEGNDRLFGLEGNDVVLGGLGDDELQGGLGNDSMTGGEGNDAFYVDAAGDKVIEKAGEGDEDVVTESLVKYTLAANVENLVLDDGAIDATGNVLGNVIDGNSVDNRIDGGAGNDDLRGGFGNDVLLGGAGNDTLDGGGGIDRLEGGAGNDTYRIQNQEDQIVEGANQGTDRIEASFISDQTLDLNNYANVENVEVLGAAKVTVIGNALANHVSGNFQNETFSGMDGNDILSGGGGNDTLDGGAGDDVLNGGSGTNTLRGGDGNDTYWLAAGHTDVVEELAGEGIDEIHADFSIKLDGGKANVENLVLNGSGKINGEGNDLANKIVANNAGNGLYGYLGNDTLTGGQGNDHLDGGEGKDLMSGGLGNDVYIVDDAGDKIMETADGGKDLVSTALSGLTLAANVEDLVATLATGTFKATGNALDNEMRGYNADDVLAGLAGNDHLMGGAGNDILDGGTGDDKLDGGAGEDELRGGAGNDYYLLDNDRDRVIEQKGQGFDWIEAGFSIDLNSNYANVEGVVLTGTASAGAYGSAADNIIGGNDGANQLDGREGADILYGFGGNDNLIGGAGNDTLVGDNLFAGSGNDILEGGAGDDVLMGNGGTNRLIGGEGNDIYSLADGATDTIVEVDGQGIDEVQISVNADLSLWSSIENLTLTGSQKIDGFGTGAANVMVGNDADNILLGRAGDDRLVGNLGDDFLNGEAGVDTMIGGIGQDTYVVDDLKDKVVEAKNEGNDTVKSYLAAYTLAANVEDLELITGAIAGSGNELANVITGNTGDNKLYGLRGNDTLRGGDGNDLLDGGDGDDALFGGDGNDAFIGGTGNDTFYDTKGADLMTGGTGNDSYIVNDIGDVVVEARNGGIDEVRVALLSYTLAANVENLISAADVAVNFTGNELNNVIEGWGTLNGGAGNDELRGSAGDDFLFGGAGNDTLIGGGGSNSLKGETGNDVYVIVEGAGNTIVEAAGEGIDEVRVGSDYVLGDNLENLTLTGGSDTGIGNVLDNVIVGSAGNNTLEGRDGSDTLKGGSGIDTLDGGAGNDMLFGEDGSDTLLGGAGKDVMTGGKGDDYYVVDDLGDKTVELANEGYDTVISQVERYTLTANVEHLVLGTGILEGFGNSSDNLLEGNVGTNKLDGGAGSDQLYGLLGDDTLIGGAGNDHLEGGLGKDIMTGGAGNDRFLFGLDQPSDFAALIGDRITDFEVGRDKLELGDLFSDLGINSNDLMGDGFLKFEINGKDTNVLVDADGGGNNFVTLVTLVGVTKATFADISLDA